MTVVLGAGALIAIDRRDRKVGAMLRVAQQQRLAVRSSAGVVAQVWRDSSRQADLSRVLSGVDVAALDLPVAKRVGVLLGAADSSGVVDAHVAHLVEPGDQLLTSDPDDMRDLLGDRAHRVDVVTV